MSKQFVIVSADDLKKNVEVAVGNALSKLSMPVKTNTSTKILVLKQAAEYIQMPIPTFREYLARKEIKGAKIGKSWRFYPEDLDQFVKRHFRKTNEEIEQEIDNKLSR